MVVKLTSPKAGSEQQRPRSYSAIKRTVFYILIVVSMSHVWTRSGSITSYTDILELYDGYFAEEQQILPSQLHSLDHSLELYSLDPRIPLSKDRYPYISLDLMVDCGLTNKNITDHDPYVLQPAPLLNRSIAFIKTHKTGSSTVANMVWRWVHARDLQRMVPRIGKNLGWPDSFPGKKSFFRGQKFDAIYNHAVYNKRWYDEFLKDPSTTFTILREPMARTISAVNYYLDKTPYNFRGWNFLLHRYRNKQHKMQTYDFYTHNGMSYDLGWYEQHNRSIEYDHHLTKIKAFIDELDKNIDVVMIMERMPESLLLLRDAIPGISVSELVYHSSNVNGNETHNNDTKLAKLYPGEKDLSELKDIMMVDRLIYKQFSERLDREWKAKVKRYPHMELLKDGLTCLQKKVDENFENKQIISKEMNDVLSEWVL